MWTEVRVRMTYGTEEVWDHAEDGAPFDYTVRSDGFLVIHSARRTADEWGRDHALGRCDAVYPPGGWCRVTGGTRTGSRSPALDAVTEVRSSRS